MVCIVKNAQSLKGLLTARHNDLPVFWPPLFPPYSTHPSEKRSQPL
jgi:hypothetical protein